MATDKNARKLLEAFREIDEGEHRIATVRATDLPAYEGSVVAPNALLPEIITYEKLTAAIDESGRPYDRELIRRAYETANEAHKGAKRRSGEPYICHPLAVARLLVDMGMDSASVAAGLLHDVVEDTPITMEELRAQFGNEIALLVDAVTKLTKIEFSSVEERQAENLRKMLLAMSQDVRVMIIKLCDRLHNMRTGDAWAEQKRRDKSLETMEIYAPIAHRLGISSIKEELEDRSLHYLDPVGYEDIARQLAEHHGEAELVKVSSLIERRLSENGMKNVVMKRRVKSIYGIYRKMFMQDKSFDEIYDIYALRIILDSVADCYTALGLIHDMYHPLPNRFKDYISTPKPNGYQSLHTTVLSSNGLPFEVQIRTREMDVTAEYGVAAHWKYKEGVKGNDDKLEERLAWVRQLLETQRASEDAGDLLRDIKSDLLPEEVFAFTPRGDVISLPAGATVIDFAYAIHSAVGNRMVGAKVNKRIAPIDHQIVTGEVIEIITGPADKGPSRDWLKIVKTSAARSKIRTWFKKMRREENIAEGKEALTREMKRSLINVPEEDLPDFLADIARRLHENTVDEMYAAIGYGGLTVSHCMPKIKEAYAKLQDSQVRPKTAPVRTHTVDGVVVEGLDSCPVKFAKCCSPLPGDSIVGFITRGFGVSIHKRSCPNISANMDDEEKRQRLVKVSWADDIKESYKATLEIAAMDRSGLALDVALEMNNMRVPLYAINARSDDAGRATIALTVGIANTEHLNKVVQRLKKIKDVLTVTRT